MTYKLPFGIAQAIAEPGKREPEIGPKQPYAELMAFPDKGQRLLIDRVETSYHNPIRPEAASRHERTQELGCCPRQQKAFHIPASR